MGGRVGVLVSSFSAVEEVIVVLFYLDDSIRGGNQS